MKATFLVDNIAQGELKGEWGLSIYIEYNDQKILLDTGSTNLFLENAKTLKIDLTDVNFGVLSHAHYDHANGLEDFFRANSKAKFYIQEAVAENCYYKYGLVRKYLGIPKGILAKYPDRFAYAKGVLELSSGIYLVPHLTEGLDKIGKRERMYQKRAGKWMPDDFSHEQSLVFKTDKGLVIFNSCSHGGVINIINEVKASFPDEIVHGIIGGFHIYNKPEREIVELASEIKKTGIAFVCTGHCSGEKGYSILSRELGSMVCQIKTGLILSF